MDIRAFRQKYPQYSKLPDDELGRRLWQRHYAGKFTWDEFAWRFGLPEPAAPAAASRAAAPVAPLTTEQPPPGGYEQDFVGPDYPIGGRNDRTPEAPSTDWLGDVVTQMGNSLRETLEPTVPGEPLLDRALRPFLPTPGEGLATERRGLGGPESSLSLGRLDEAARQLLPAGGMSPRPAPTLLESAAALIRPDTPVPPGGDPGVALALGMRPPSAAEQQAADLNALQPAPFLPTTVDAAAAGAVGPFGEAVGDPNPLRSPSLLAKLAAEQAGTQMRLPLPAGAIGTLGGTVAWLGDILPNQPGAPLRALGENLNDQAAQMMPSDPSYFEKVLAALGSTAPLVLGARALGGPPSLQALLAATLESAAEASGAQREAQNDPLRTVDPTAVRDRTFAANLPMLWLTDRLGLFTEKGAPWWRRTKSAGFEGSQESYQSGASDLAQAKAPDPAKMAEEGSIGAIVGGALGGARTPTEQLGDYLLSAEGLVHVDPAAIDALARDALAPAPIQPERPAGGWADEFTPENPPPTTQPPAAPPPVEALGDLLSRLRPPAPQPMPEAAPAAEAPQAPPAAPEQGPAPTPDFVGLGKMAFARGLAAAPVLDKNLQKALDDAGITPGAPQWRQAITDWARGWQIANLDAPVDAAPAGEEGEKPTAQAPAPPQPPALDADGRKKQRARAEAYGFRAYRQGLGKQQFDADTEAATALASFEEVGVTPGQVRAWWQFGWLDAAQQAGDGSMDPQESIYANNGQAGQRAPAVTPPMDVGGRLLIDQLTDAQLESLSEQVGKKKRVPASRMKKPGVRANLIKALEQAENAGKLDATAVGRAGVWTGRKPAKPTKAAKPTLTAEEKRQRAELTKKRLARADIENDDLLTIVAKLGGIDWASLRGDLPQDYYNTVRASLKRVFRKKGSGLDVDMMRELLAQDGIGFPFVTVDDLTTALADSLQSGRKVYSPAATAPYRAAVEAQDRAAQGRARAEAEARRAALDAEFGGETGSAPDPFGITADGNQFNEDWYNGEQERESRVYDDLWTKARLLDEAGAEEEMERLALAEATEQEIAEALNRFIEENSLDRGEEGGQGARPPGAGAATAEPARGQGPRAEPESQEAATTGRDGQVDAFGRNETRQDLEDLRRRKDAARSPGEDVSPDQGGEGLFSGDGRLAPELFDQPSQPSQPSQTRPSGLPEGLGANNKVVTREMAEAAIARIKAKLGGPGTLHAGIDPTILADGATVGVFLIESKVREFGEWARQMIGVFGDAIRPYLVSLYEAARDSEDANPEDVALMTEPGQVRPILKTLSEPASRATATIEGGDLVSRLAGRDVAIEIEAGGQTMTVQRDAAQALTEADALVNALEEIRRRCL